MYVLELQLSPELAIGAISGLFGFVVQLIWADRQDKAKRIAHLETEVVASLEAVVAAQAELGRLIRAEVRKLKSEISGMLTPSQRRSPPRQDRGE